MKLNKTGQNKWFNVETKWRDEKKGGKETNRNRKKLKVQSERAKRGKTRRRGERK